MYKNIRPSAVAGQFYEADADRLKHQVQYYLDKTEKQDIKMGAVRAIMTPHAGYDFSAPVAAAGYKQIEGKKTGTVVILCNSHTAYFDGLAIDGHDAWQTPLGQVGVDRKLADKLIAADKSIHYNNEVHAGEHALEVQLPFLQTVLPDGFMIVPILFGNTGGDGYARLARALENNLGPDDLVVASSDMSHYPKYEDANTIDQETLGVIKTADVEKMDDYTEEVEERDVPGEQTILCGIDGVKTVMELYGLAGWDRIGILKYANSGDAEMGDRERVVGYGAVAFGLASSSESKETNMETAEDNSGVDLSNILTKQEQEELIGIAKQTVESYVKSGQVPDFEIKDERLQSKEGAFVTLHENGQLRGCIGQIIPSGAPLWRVVRDMAVAACSEDNRFNPVTPDELDKLDYEVSVLSAPRAIDNWHKIELGKHGVIVRKGARAGVFLPQVADETGWDIDEFLSELCAQKAGLPPSCYKDDKSVELQVFTAQVFGENT